MRITLVRHGQSEANVGQHDYTTAGDHRVELTPLGIRQAIEAGKRLKPILAPSTGKLPLVYVSPYQRTRQTLTGLLAGAEAELPVRVFEDPRLRETDHGYGASVEDQQELRAVHGWFYYRYAGGESPADCSDRISSFLESMMRQVQRKGPDNVVIVTHGLAIRCFVMRFLHLTVEQFEQLANPDNCDIITIDMKYNILDPVFTSVRWAVEGIKLRPSVPLP